MTICVQLEATGTTFSSISSPRMRTPHIGTLELVSKQMSIGILQDDTTSHGGVEASPGAHPMSSADLEGNKEHLIGARYASYSAKLILQQVIRRSFYRIACGTLRIDTASCVLFKARQHPTIYAN